MLFGEPKATKHLASSTRQIGPSRASGVSRCDRVRQRRFAARGDGDPMWSLPKLSPLQTIPGVAESTGVDWFSKHCGRTCAVFADGALSCRVQRPICENRRTAVWSAYACCDRAVWNGQRRAKSLWV